MQSFDISWLALFKIMGVGLFTYIVLPLFLVVRDLLLHKAIEKWIINEKLSFVILICESDRWYLENKYNKDIHIHSGSTGKTYKIDGAEVSESEFKNYDDGLKLHSNRFASTNSKIVLKQNLVVWLTKQYKQADGLNIIPDLRTQAYKQVEQRENA